MARARVQHLSRETRRKFAAGAEKAAQKADPDTKDTKKETPPAKKAADK